MLDVESESLNQEPPRISPPFDEPPHLLHPSGALAIWFTDPPGMVTQFQYGARATDDLAQFVARLGFAALLELRGRRRDRLCFIHDLSLMSGYEPDARQTMTMWGLEARELVERVVVVPPRQGVESVRLGLEGSAAVLVARGMLLDFAPTIEEAVARCKVEALRRGRCVTRSPG
jgi:hypothetical protein